MIKQLIVAFGVTVTAAHAAATERVPARVIGIVDGDTIKVEARHWPNTVTTVNVRLNGVDTPELRRSKCPGEKAAAQRARDRLATLTPENSDITLVNVKPGKYGGRIVAHVFAGPLDVAAILIAEGHGRVYKGRRESWCQ